MNANDKNDKKIFQRWIIQNNLSPSTEKVYKSVIKKFITATGKSLTELYNEALTEEDNRVPVHRKKIKNYFIDFQAYLEQLDIRDSTKKKNIQIILSFYKSLDIQLPTIKTPYDNSPDPANTTKMLTKELIQQMMEKSSLRDKAILSFMALTGQAQKEVTNLTIEQLIQAYNTIEDLSIFNVKDIIKNKELILANECVKLNMHRQKTNTYYWTYLPAETSKYIISYLQERYNSLNEKLHIRSTSDPVFVTKYGTPFSNSAVGKMVTYRGHECGFDNPSDFEGETRKLLERKEGNHHIYKSHNFRKYFINMCRRYAGTRYNDTEAEFIFSGRELADFWVGHTVKGSISHYLQYNDDDFEQMRKQYLQVLPYMSLEIELRSFDTEERKEFEEMKEQYNDMQKEIEDLKEFIMYTKLRKKFDE